MSQSAFFMHLAAMGRTRPPTSYLALQGGQGTYTGAALTLGPDYRLRWWLRMSTAQAGQAGYLHCLTNTAANQYIALIYGFAGPCFSLWRFNSANTASPSTRIDFPAGTADGAWHEFEVRVSGGVASLFLDRVQVNSGAFAVDPLPSSCDVNLGHLGSSYILQCDVQGLQLTRGRNLLLSYPLATDATDRSRNAYDLTLSGSTAFL